MILTGSRFMKVYGALCFVYLFFVVPGGFPAFASPAGADDYKGELTKQAGLLALSGQRTWDVLLFYRQRGGGRESVIDDPRFFLASSGKTDPAAELDATIRGLFAPAELGDDHPRCRFPARFQWLQGELGIDPAKLPNPVCGKLDEALKAVDPRSVVLVFPAAHTNGPASMFGHTLLRIGSSYQSELLSYAVNYAAHSTDTNGLVYAYKGIFGYYSGYFSILPYYEKLKEYSDLEHRDVWEYSLRLSPAEVRQMVLHIWELQGIASEYYFFDENCSFMLLFLLEAGRPELRLTNEYWDRWGFWVIPVDTIATLRRAGLIDKVKYRPSQATRIRHRAGLLPDEAGQQALDVAMQRLPASAEALSGISPEERRQVLDLAAEFVQYRYSRKELTQEEFQTQFRTILKARSGLGTGDTAAGDVPAPPQPEGGHLPGKLTAGAGVRRDQPYLELSWQPAYHDLLDPDAGYTPGAQINFISASGRYYPEEGRILLQSFHPVDIISLAPRDRFFQPFSWKVTGGLDRKTFSDGEDHLFLRLNTGGGFAWILPYTITSIGYIIPEADINLSDRFENKVALGGGVTVGVLANLTERWKAHLSASGLFYGIEASQYYRLALDQHLNFSRNSGILLHASWERSYDQNRAEAGLSWVRYF
jgi:hypothetical protein